MKKFSKLFVLLPAISMLVACGGNSGKVDPTPGPAEGNLINVIYFKSYVSPARAEELRQGFIASLGEQVDATKINFFESASNKVGTFTDEILFYNEDHPNDQIDVVLGANGFDNAGEESRAQYLAKYVSDEKNYNYGTSSDMANRSNRKFWYDKEEAEDKYVKGLQTYLQTNWLTPDDPGPGPGEHTDYLHIGVYGHMVSEERVAEITTGFASYLSSISLTISHITTEYESTTASVGDYMATVNDYNDSHLDGKLDVLLGLRADTGNAITAGGYERFDNTTDYMYADKTDSGRRFWYDADSGNLANIMTFKDFLDEEYVEHPEATKVQLSQTAADVKPGESITVTASTDAELLGATYTAEVDKTYASAAVDGSSITVSLTEAAVVGEKVTVTVRSGELTPATLEITVVSKEAPQTTTYTVAFYQRYITNERIEELETALTAVFADIENVDVAYVGLGTESTVTSGGTTVAQFAGLVADYNTAHSNATIDCLLGANGDSNAKDLAAAGYYKYSDQAYTYGTDSSRKLWLKTLGEGESLSAGDSAVIDYLAENWVPVATKVVLNQTEATVQQGESITLTASTDVAVDGAVYTASSDKTYATTEVGGNQIVVTLSADAVVDEVATITVSCGDLTPATCAITVTGEPVVEEHHLSIAFYVKFISSDNIIALTNGITKYIADNELSFDSVSFVSLGDSSTNVVGFKDLVVAENEKEGAHPINVLLGCNGDSNNALKNAGYSQVDSTSYTYGTDAKRKLWCATGMEDDICVTTIQAYLAANWAVAA